MKSARSFVAALADVQFERVFNPYRDRCGTHDLPNGPAVRRKNLRGYLDSLEKRGVDTVWMGRDLGYRGGRRTGLALTDERHLSDFAHCYPGSIPNRATSGMAVSERTAAEIWSVLTRLDSPPLLWNVFPFHPHEAEKPFTNRRFSSSELAAVSDLNQSLMKWMRIRRIVCIGKDSAKYASKFSVDIKYVRHPSYGGTSDFRAGMSELYSNEWNAIRLRQPDLL